MYAYTHKMPLFNIKCFIFFRMVKAKQIYQINSMF